MRILFISDHGCQIGGGERSMFELVSYLINGGNSVYCILPNRGHFFSRLTEAGAVCFKFPMATIARRYNPFILLWYMVSVFVFSMYVFFLAKKKNIDVIHVNKTTSLFYGVCVSLLTWKPLVWHVRSYNRRFGIVGRLLFLCTDAVICISHNLAAPFLKTFRRKKDKISIVHNGVNVLPLDKISYTSNELAKCIPHQRSFVVGMVGRITACKSIETFLEAFTYIKRETSEIQGVLVGDCVTSNPVQLAADRAYKDKIERMCRHLCLEDYITFVEYQNEPESLMREMDVVVLTSIEEPFGRILIEAMALGVPVIGCNSGGVPEIIIPDESGVLVPPRNPQALAEAIMRLFEHPILRRKFAKMGWERAHRCFSTEVYGKTVEEIYRKVTS
ncbi:MAG: glycosyltransferase family 4 protein [bacterium]|nr:glycosyltransferase family 4 protein [bacterium]